MSRICEVCGKKPHAGRSIARKGMAKKKGGVGKNITGVSRRRFLPNLQSVRVMKDDGGIKRMRVCTECIKSDRISKAS